MEIRVALLFDAHTFSALTPRGRNCCTAQHVSINVRAYIEQKLCIAL